MSDISEAEERAEDAEEAGVLQPPEEAGAEGDDTPGTES